MLMIFSLAACIDDISLTQKKDAGTIKEVKGVTYFIAKSGALYEKIKGVFVESKFVTNEEINAVKSYKHNTIATLPYTLESKIKYIDGRLFSFIVIKPKYIYAKEELKKFHKKEAIRPVILDSKNKTNMENKNNDNVIDDYSANSCKDFLSKAEFKSNVDTESVQLKPLNDWNDNEPCKHIKLFAQDYKHAKGLINKILQYNKLLSETNLVEKKKVLNNLSLVYKNDEFKIFQTNFKSTSNTVNKYGNIRSYSQQKSERINFNTFVSINKMHLNWRESMIFKDFKEKIINLQREINKLSNKAFDPDKLLNEDLVKDTSQLGN